MCTVYIHICIYAKGMPSDGTNGMRTHGDHSCVLLGERLFISVLT